MADFGFGKDVIDVKDAANVLKLGNENVSGSSLDNALKITSAICDDNSYFKSSGIYPAEFFAIFALWRLRFYFNKFSENELKQFYLKMDNIITTYENDIHDPEKDNTAAEGKAWGAIGEALETTFQGKDSNWTKLENLKQQSVITGTVKHGWENVTDPIKLILNKIKAYTEKGSEDTKAAGKKQREIELNRALQGAVTQWLSGALDDLKSICKTYDGGALQLNGLPEGGEWFTKAKLVYKNGDVYLPRTLVLDKIKDSEVWHEWINAEAKEHAGDKMSKEAMENTHAENEAATDTAPRQGEES